MPWLACVLINVVTVQACKFVTQKSNVAVEARHCNPVLELAATTGDFRTARMTLDKMTNGSLAAPNAASYECLAEVIHRCVTLCILYLKIILLFSEL